MRGEEDVCQSGMFAGEEEWGGGVGGRFTHVIPPTRHND